jgi:hypothetical protein
MGIRSYVGHTGCGECSDSNCNSCEFTGSLAAETEVCNTCITGYYSNAGTCTALGTATLSQEYFVYPVEWLYSDAGVADRNTYIANIAGNDGTAYTTPFYSPYLAFAAAQALEAANSNIEIEVKIYYAKGDRYFIKCDQDSLELA